MIIQKQYIKGFVIFISAGVFCMGLSTFAQGIAFKGKPEPIEPTQSMQVIDMPQETQMYTLSSKEPVIVKTEQGLYLKSDFDVRMKALEVRMSYLELQLKLSKL